MMNASAVSRSVVIGSWRFGYCNGTVIGLQRSALFLSFLSSRSFSTLNGQESDRKFFEIDRLRSAILRELYEYYDWIVGCLVVRPD